MKEWEDRMEVEHPVAMGILRAVAGMVTMVATMAAAVLAWAVLF